MDESGRLVILVLGIILTTTRDRSGVVVVTSIILFGFFNDRLCFLRLRLSISTLGFRGGSLLRSSSRNVLLFVFLGLLVTSLLVLLFSLGLLRRRFRLRLALLFLVATQEISSALARFDLSLRLLAIGLGSRVRLGLLSSALLLLVFLGGFRGVFGGLAGLGFDLLGLFRGCVVGAGGRSCSLSAHA